MKKNNNKNKNQFKNQALSALVKMLILQGICTIFSCIDTQMSLHNILNNFLKIIIMF